jgi:hypothetical protein
MALGYTTLASESDFFFLFFLERELISIWRIRPNSSPRR